MLMLTIMALTTTKIIGMEQKLEKAEPTAPSSSITPETSAEKLKSPTTVLVHQSQDSIERLLAGSIMLPGNYLD